jgi:hypothetical protein
VGEILRSLGCLSEEQLSRALAEQYQLEYIDLEKLPPGWNLMREFYSSKCKSLKILPLSDPQQKAWLVISELTEDQKLLLHASELFDLSRIQFAVASATPQLQVIDEHLTWDEPDAAVAAAPMPMPAPPQWLLDVLDVSQPGWKPLPPEALESLALPAPPPGTPLDEQARSCRAALAAAQHAVPPPVLTMSPDRLVTCLGSLWGRSAAELRRAARVALVRGPRFRVEVVPSPRPPDPLRVLGRPRIVEEAPLPQVEVHVTLPWFAVDEEPPGPGWPADWPPADLTESLDPLLARLCHIPASLKTGERSLRWIGRSTPARAELNRLTLGSVGVSLGTGRIDSIAEFWDSLLARFRRLEANRAVRRDWRRWRSLAIEPLEVTPGGILCLAALALDRDPANLDAGLRIDVKKGPALAVELFRSPEGLPVRPDDLSGITLAVTVPDAPVG